MYLLLDSTFLNSSCLNACGRKDMLFLSLCCEFLKRTWPVEQPLYHFLDLKCFDSGILLGSSGRFQNARLEGHGNGAGNGQSSPLFGNGSRNNIKCMQDKNAFNRPWGLRLKFTFSFQDASRSLPEAFHAMEEIETARLEKITNGRMHISSNHMRIDTQNITPLYIYIGIYI